MIIYTNRTFDKGYSVTYNGAAQDLTGVDVTFKVTDSLGEGATVLLDKALTQNATVNSQADLHLTEAETDALGVGQYYFAVIYDDTGNDIKESLDDGELIVKHGV